MRKPKKADPVIRKSGGNSNFGILFISMFPLQIALLDTQNSFTIMCNRGVAQWLSAPAWGAGGRRFKSDRPDLLIIPNIEPKITKLQNQESCSTGFVTLAG